MSEIKGRCPQCGARGELYRYCVYVCVRCWRCGYQGTKLETDLANAVNRVIDYWNAVADIKETNEKTLPTQD